MWPTQADVKGTEVPSPESPAHRDSHTKMGTSQALPNTWETAPALCRCGRKPGARGPTPAWRAEVPSGLGLGDTCAPPAQAALVGNKVQEGQRLAQGCHGPQRRGLECPAQLSPGDSFENWESTVGLNQPFQ